MYKIPSPARLVVRAFHEKRKPRRNIVFSSGSSSISATSPRPDVGVLYKSGRVKAIEVASKTDVVSKLLSRNNNFMRANGINGDVKVSRLAVLMDKIKGKFKAKCH